MINIICGNLNHEYNIDDNIHTFTNMLNNHYINICSESDGYICFDINTDSNYDDLLMNNSKIKQNTKQCIDINKNKNVHIVSNSDMITKVTITNLKFFYNNFYNMVLITSKIYVSNNPFTYINTRSIYSTTERFNQTIDTINSVKKHIPNYFIVLFDNSIFTSDEYDCLAKNVDIFLNMTNNTKLYEFTNNSANKAYGEISQTYNALQFIQNMTFNNMFKISGRYIINDTFDYDIFNNNDNLFKRDSSIDFVNYYYTSLYKISKNNFNEYYKVVNELYEFIQTSNIYDNVSYEVFFPIKLKFTEINHLGLTENIAVRNEINLI